MYAIIKVERSAYDLLYYHEQKVKRGVAECLYAGNMIKDADDLSMKEKQFYLQRLESLNELVARRTMSLILMCHQDDRPDNKLMEKLGRDYVREMRLDRQPYLIYRHRDTRYPHLHIVIGRIQADGTAIAALSPAMRLQSLRLAREMERRYGLAPVGQGLTEKESQLLHTVQAVRLGVTPLRPTLNAVLEHVLPNHVYTSLEELNILLRPYRIEATRCSPDSITYRNRGLLYIPLNDRGEREKIYVKSSGLKSRPGLRYLEERFTANRMAEPAIRQRVMTSVDWIFYKQRVSVEALAAALRPDKIEIVKGEGQRLYYIDRLNKAVLSADRLGYRYSLDGLRERCIPAEEYQRLQQEQKLAQTQKNKLKQTPKIDF